MPKRIVDGDALWRSQKLKAVRPEFRAEYANLLPLAEANGSFDAGVDRVWSDVYSFNRDIDVRKVCKILDEFEKVGLLKRWQQNGKTWGYWMGIEKTGRLPSEKHLKRYTNLPPLPPDYPGRSRIIPDRTGPDPEGLGVGIGLGIGSGVGATTEEEMSAASTIETLCRTILHKRPEPDSWSVWEEVRKLSKAYGQKAVVAAFRDWAESALGSEMKGPVEAFLNVADGILAGVVVVKAGEDLQDLLDQMAESSDRIMMFDSAQMTAINKFVQEYSRGEVWAAFQDFWSRVDDDYQKKWAVKNFIEQAPQILRLNHRKAEDDEKTRQAVEADRAAAELESARRLKEAQAIDDALAVEIDAAKALFEEEGGTSGK